MENVTNFIKEKVTQIQETWRVPIKRNPKKPTSRHIIIKMAKFQDKVRILKAGREKKEVTYKGAPIRLATDFSMETVSYTHLTLPTNKAVCRSRWSPYH